METSYASINYRLSLVADDQIGTFKFDNRRFPVEDVPNPAALVKRISGGSEPAEKSQTAAVHATVKHLLDFYKDEFPRLEGQHSWFVLMMYYELMCKHCPDWHQRWLAAGSPLPAQQNASGSNDGGVANDLWNLQIPIRWATAAQG